ncbi:enhancer of polycomb homolog 1-like isoform X2 [Babylonia areolata]|uniref:enhancer of polycomb homolog 1-like isoform X2 n=1 Tax=Babylonia areolata TaxID=304850 RepID=UPI003FCFB249
MSKVSFRARALDVSKPMPIFRSEDIPDMHDFDKINRAVVQMPTGMEKEEEMETHLQNALTAQQFYGTAEKRTIPIPGVQSVDDIDDRYSKLYNPDFRLPKQYIHVEALGMEQEIPDYDLDSEDECWLQEQSKKMEISSSKFEEMMDRLEKGSGQQVVTLQEAKLLLKEDDDLIISVYDYWLNKRLRLEMPLIPQVKSEKRDGTTTNNPYVAFRRRTEKMQTRKNRKNDEVSYEKMLKLKRDMLKALTLTHFLKRREKSKKEILQLTLEVMEKRYQMGDFSGTMLAEAEAERAKMPSFIPPFMFNSQGHGTPAYSGEEVPPVRKKRPYRRRQKQPQQPRHPHTIAAAMATAASFGDVDILHHDLDSSEEDMMSPALSPSDHEDEHDPDGLFAFKRRKTCNYYAPLHNRLGNWPWSNPSEGGKGDKRHRFSLTTLPGGRCIGFARRRVGRGGRVVLDRGFTPWDDGLEKMNLTSGQSFSGVVGDYITHIREQKIPYYRPKSPPPDDDESSQDGERSSLHPAGAPSKPSTPSSQEFNVESFRSHREQLLAMHMEQEAVRLKQDSVVNPSSNIPLSSDLGYSFSSQPTSRFMLDSASAQFAVTAVIGSAELESKRAKAEEAESVNHVVVGAAGDSKQTEKAPPPPPPPDHHGAATSSSLLPAVPTTSLSSSSSVASSPVVLSSLPAIMAPKSVGLSVVPSIRTVSPKTVLTSSGVSLSAVSLTPSAVSVMTQPAGRPRLSNGPLATPPVPAASIVRAGRTAGSSAAATIVQLPQRVSTAPAMRAVVPVPSPNPIVTASATSMITVHGPTPTSVGVGTALAMDKLNNKVMLASGVGASSTMCSMASSPLSILKSGQEEGKSAVHLFAADTQMPMDVS